MPGYEDLLRDLLLQGVLTEEPPETSASDASSPYRGVMGGKTPEFSLAPAPVEAALPPANILLIPGTNVPAEDPRGMVPDTRAQLTNRRSAAASHPSPPEPPSATPPVVAPGSPLGRSMPWLTATGRENLPLRQTGNMVTLDTRPAGGTAPTMAQPQEGTATWIPAAPGQAAAEVASGLRPRVSPETQAAQDAARVDAQLQAYAERKKAADAEAKQAEERTRRQEQAAFVKPLQDILTRARLDAASSDPLTRAQGEAAVVKVSPILQGILTQAGMTNRMEKEGGAGARETFTTDATGKVHSVVTPTEKPISPTTPNADEILAAKLGFDLKRRIKTDGTPMTQADFALLDREREASATRISTARATGTAIGQGDPLAIDAAVKKIKSLESSKAAVAIEGFGPEAMDFQVKQYLTPGSPQFLKQPSFGMGSAGNPLRIAFMRRVGEMAKEMDVTPESQAVLAAVGKATQSEYQRVVANRGPIMAFAHTAERTLQQALALSDQVDRTEIPLINKALMAGKEYVGGDPMAAKLHAQLNIGVTELAKVMSGSSGGQMSSDAARKEVASMLNYAQTQEQFREVLKMLVEQDIPNRVYGYDKMIQQYEETLGNVTRNKKGTSGVTNQSPPPTPAVTTPSGGHRLSGTKTTRPDGTYPLKDGTTITVKGGVVQ